MAIDENTLAEPNDLVKLTAKQIHRFWKKVNKTDTCWLWTGGINRSGYGNVSLWDKTFSAHKISFQIKNGAVPNGLWILHKCDVKNCVNPSHLYAGTRQDNIRDAISRGRLPAGDRNGSRKHPERLRRGDNHPSRISGTPWMRGDNNWMRKNPDKIKPNRGEDAGNVKLTNEKVIAIRLICKTQKLPQHLVAKQYGVSQALISRIFTRRSWRHI